MAASWLQGGLLGSARRPRCGRQLEPARLASVAPVLRPPLSPRATAECELCAVLAAGCRLGQPGDSPDGRVGSPISLKPAMLRLVASVGRATQGAGPASFAAAPFRPPARCQRGASLRLRYREERGAEQTPADPQPPASSSSNGHKTEVRHRARARHQRAGLPASAADAALHVTARRKSR
jgi:hypothetical protein